MIITLKDQVSEEELEALFQFIRENGYRPQLVEGEVKKIVELIGTGKLTPDDVRKFTCVEEVHKIQRPYKRISLEGGRRRRIINVKGREIGGEKIILMMGPCAVESYEQTDAIAKIVASFPTTEAIGGYILRGGAFKPRTSPYSFEGLGEEGLKILREVGEKYQLPIVTEVMSEYEVDLVAEYADILQVGTRNFQNFRLLDRLGGVDKPVLLKRGMSGTLEEFLLAAERIVVKGNPNVILCLRGIRTFNDAYRNDVDVADIVRLKQLTILPIVFDPSHSTGNRDAVIPVSLGAVAMGADGLLVDVHIDPEKALVDGAQALWEPQARAFVKMVDIIKKAQKEAMKYYLTAEEARHMVKHGTPV